MRYWLYTDIPSEPEVVCLSVFSVCEEAFSGSILRGHLLLDSHGDSDRELKGERGDRRGGDRRGRCRDHTVAPLECHQVQAQTHAQHQ